MNEKTTALLDTAFAFFHRGPMIQYDQSRMDALFRTTSRRDIFAAPEEATVQNTVFLDCSGFVFACYYQTFGYQLPATLTHEMVELESMRVFYYELTGKESEEQRKRVLSEFRACLEPGDIVVYQYRGNGHAMLYADDKHLLHCCPYGDVDGYRYRQGHETFYPSGGILDTPLKELLVPAPGGTLSRHYLFLPDRTRFGVLRPLSLLGEPLPQARQRSDRDSNLRNLVAQVVTSHPRGRTVAKGDVVTYSLHVDNIGETEVSILGKLEPPAHTSLVAGGELCLVVPPGSRVSGTWAIKVNETDSCCLDSPIVTLNGMQVFVPSVLCGKNLTNTHERKLRASAKDLVAGGQDDLQAIASVYPIPLPGRFTSVSAVIADLFRKVDLPFGLGLRRHQGAWAEDIAVPGCFGGIGVTSPEVIAPGRRHERIRRITLEAVQVGDIIACCDDPMAAKAYGCVCVDTGVLYGKFAYGLPVSTLCGQEAEKWFEKLFSRFCFVLLRPSMAE